ncbi:MAG: ferritin [Coriobacteriales bacterium]|nr:ferritin [Coriobacteriales bacterium]
MSEPYANMNLIDVLNDLRARELGAIVQYMRHHYIVTGPEGVALAGDFKGIAIEEMKHAEELGERIDALGGDPTAKAEKVNVEGVALRELAKADYNAEMDAVMRYRAAIRVAEAKTDYVTRRMLEDILAQEEDHATTFMNMLGNDVTGHELLNPKLAE